MCVAWWIGCINGIGRPISMISTPVSHSSVPKVVILGAGVSGLSAAYELTRRMERERLKVDITVLEASQYVGGKVKTETAQGFIFEAGPDSFITAKPHALELISELGLSEQLLPTNPGPQTVYVYSAGRLRPVPEGAGLAPGRLWPFLSSGLFSWKAKLRLACEPLVPRATGEPDESIAAFIRRRLGPEILEKMAGPMLGGIYAGDCENLSLQSTFPSLRRWNSAAVLSKPWARRGARAPAIRPCL